MVGAAYLLYVFAVFTIGYPIDGIGEVTTADRIIQKSPGTINFMKVSAPKLATFEAAEVSIVLKEIDVPRRIIKANVSIYFPYSILTKNLVYENSISDYIRKRGPLAKPDSANCFKRQDSSLDRLAQFRFESATGNTSSTEIRFDIVTKDLKNTDTGFCTWSRSDLEVPVLGMDRIYPLDWFGGQYIASIDLFGGASLFALYQDGKNLIMNTWPVIIMITALPQIGEFTVYTSHEQVNQNWFGQFDLLIKRGAIGRIMAVIAIALLYTLSAFALHLILEHYKVPMKRSYRTF